MSPSGVLPTRAARWLTDAGELTRGQVRSEVVTDGPETRLRDDHPGREAPPVGQGHTFHLELRGGDEGCAGPGQGLGEVRGALQDED